MELVARLLRTFADADREDLDEWLELDGNERLAIGEQLSLEAYGDDEPRLRRVLQIAELSEC